MTTAFVPQPAPQPVERPTPSEPDGVALLKRAFAEPGATVQVRKVTEAGYRVNWSRRQATGIEGLVSLRIYKSAFVYLHGTSVTLGRSQ